MKDSTIVYRSFYEAIKELPKDVQADVWNAVFDYSLNFNLTELQGVGKTVFTLIKPQLDANIKRYESGIKPKQKRITSEPKAKGKRITSEPEANVNVNDNVNKKEKENVNDFAFDFDPSFLAVLTEWFEYKKARKETYKTDKSKEAFYKKLHELSRGNNKTAKEIIDRSFANNWAGIFSLNGQQQALSPQNDRPEPGTEEYRRRFGGYPVIKDYKG